MDEAMKIFAQTALVADGWEKNVRLAVDGGKVTQVATGVGRFGATEE